MLTAQETDQLVRDMQREFPALSVAQRRYRASREYVVVVRDPANGNEVWVTSLKGDWRRKVAAMVPITRPRRQRPSMSDVWQARNPRQRASVQGPYTVDQAEAADRRRAAGTGPPP